MEISLPRPLAGTPVRFLVLAGAGAVGTFVFGRLIPWDPWLWSNTVLADGWGRLVAGLSLLVWTLTPVLAVVWSWRTAVVALTPFALFTWGFSDQREWSFAIVVSLAAAAMVATWRGLRAALPLAGAALVPVASYLVGGTTMLLPYQTSVRMWDDDDPVDKLFKLLLFATAVGSCVAVAWWMRSSALASRRTAELEARSSEVERESAVVGERARLARDLHDVVAHHVSLIAVRAETAPFTQPDLPPGARHLLAEIAEESRRALDELRGVLGILRRSSESPELAPQPSAAEIAALVESSRRAGDRVVLTQGDLSGVSRTAGYVAYRVVQEALTNVRRHAPGAQVLVAAEPQGDGGIVVRVENDTEEAPVEGRGLTGMRERVEAVGGALELWHADGRLVVTASIPGAPE